MPLHARRIESRHRWAQPHAVSAQRLGLKAICLLCMGRLLTSSPLAFTLPRAAAKLRSQRLPQASLRATGTIEAAVDEAPAVVVPETPPTTSYIAMNRFMVRDGQGPAFEQRWAQRKSSLRELDGFEWFALLRRVQSPDPTDEYSYSSFTWWANKKNFNSWRKGPAFKEAHGGGDIFAFLGMIISGFLTSKGPPKPCFWRGSQVDLPSDPPQLKFSGGPGSKPGFDGSKELDPEVFVSMRRFGKDDDAEKSLQAESEQLVGEPGFRFSHVLRRDQEADDGAGAALISVWDSKADYVGSVLGEAAAPPRGEALYEGVLVLEK